MVMTKVMTNSAIDVGDRKQLFIDDLFTASSEGIRLTVNAPRKTGEILLQGDNPWEPMINCWSTVMQDDDGLLKLWYEGYDANIDRSRDMIRYCYAVSKDGLHWQKPALAIHEYNGSVENNIVMVGTGYAKPNRLIAGSVFKDPTAPAHRRYRFPYLKLNGYVSPDGIHWTPAPHAKGGLERCSGDTQAVGLWDDNYRRYVYYTRRNNWMPSESGEPLDKYAWSTKINGDQVLRRCVTRAESDDFITWTEPEDVLSPDDDDVGCDFMTSNVLKYPLADRAYILLVAYYQYEPNTLDVRLAVSRDGIHFTRPSRDPVIPNGEGDAFDSKQVFVTHGFVRMGDEIWIYYKGCEKEHQQVWESESKHGMVFSRAVLRLDGYASMDVGAGGGVLSTVPLVFTGSRLELNLATSTSGLVQLELFDADDLDPQGRPRRSLAKTKPLQGDSVAKTVTWEDGGEVDRFAGRPVTLQFSMRDAKLFAFQFCHR